MVDWDLGSYERTATELAPVAEAVVARAALSADDDVLDVACGTGNAALLAAGTGARVTGIDSAARLLEVARQRARVAGLDVTFAAGDLLKLPVDDACADVVLSVFGVIFASDPAGSLREIARVLRPDGRAFISAWIPAGPINDMLAAIGRVAGRITPAQPPPRFAWADPDVLGPAARDAGLRLRCTTSDRLAIRDASPDAYFAGTGEHPMGLATRPVIEAAGALDELREAVTRVLSEANEDPAAFLVHSPYVVHELAGPAR
jgi:SAM-dependent methyltransferase